MEVKTIKGIGNERWNEFKALAARKNVNLGALFEIILDDYSRRSDSTWDKILSGKRILSDGEADEMEKKVVKLRKEKGFRL